MSGTNEGRVAIVTGAGRGFGRCHALELARQGAAVVVNDLGVEVGGELKAGAPAEEVVEEIRSAGGRAVANGDDVSSTDGATRLIAAALDEFGRLDAIVNNAGVLRDRMLVNLSDEDWDTEHACSSEAAAGSDSSSMPRELSPPLIAATMSGLSGRA